MRLALIALGACLAIADAHAAGFTTLYRFTNGTDGETPVGGVVQDSAGVLYGTTANGGDPSCHRNCTAYGTVYSFSMTAGLKTLVYFTGPNGGGPQSTLLLSGATLYGAAGGGANNDGVIFSMRTNGTNYTLLHQFDGADGMMPEGTPQLSRAGILYGITYHGGPYGDGVLFSLARDGTYTMLHAFTGGSDGGNPTSLLISSTGMLFGSTANGGAVATCAPPTGCGTVFNYNPATDIYAVQYEPTSTSAASPLLGSIGPGPTLYGTTAGIGVNDVFALGPDGFSTVANLTVYQSGVQYPGPTLAPDGSLILTVGPSNYGFDGYLLRIKNGAVTGLSFSGGYNGGAPAGQPFVNSSGDVFGTTEFGGKCGECGTIYEVTP